MHKNDCPPWLSTCLIERDARVYYPRPWLASSFVTLKSKAPPQCNGAFACYLWNLRRWVWLEMKPGQDPKHLYSCSSSFTDFKSLGNMSLELNFFSRLRNMENSSLHYLTYIVRSQKRCCQIHWRIQGVPGTNAMYWSNFFHFHAGWSLHLWGWHPFPILGNPRSATELWPNDLT